MPSRSEQSVPRCLLCGMNCPMGARRNVLGHVQAVYPADLGFRQGACVRGVTAAHLVNAPEQLYTAQKGAAVAAVEDALADMAREAAQFAPHEAAIVVNVNRPLEGVLALAELCRAVGCRFGAFVPPEDVALVRARLTAGPPFAQMAESTLVVAIGDPFSSHPAVAAAVRDAQFGGRGNRLVSVDSAWGRTAQEADEAITVHPMRMAAFVAAVALECGAEGVRNAYQGRSAQDLCGNSGIPYAQVASLAAALKRAKAPAFIVANPAGRYADGASVAAIVRELASAVRAQVWPLLMATNSAALPALKERYGALEFGQILAEAEQGRLKALLVVGFDPSNCLPDRFWRPLREGCKLLAHAYPLRASPLTELADFALPLALPWEEEGTVLDEQGHVMPFPAWLEKPAGVLDTAQLAGRIAQLAGVDLPGRPDVQALASGSGGAPETVALLGGVASGTGLEEGKAVLVGMAEPQGYRGGLSLACSTWQQRLCGEEAAVLSAELARALGVADGDVVELGEGEALVARCKVGRNASGPVVAVPSHWPLANELLGWVRRDGAIEPAPAPVAIRKCPHDRA